MAIGRGTPPRSPQDAVRAARGLPPQRSGKSVTAWPLPHTTHFITNAVAAEIDLGLVMARANWMVQVYQPRTAKQHVNFGHYEVRLVQSGAVWLIASKKIHLKNDQISTVVDFYML